MRRIKVVTRLRLLAAIAPVILIPAAAYIAGGLYIFGNTIDTLHDRQLLAIQSARGMEVTLYRMEWARSRADATQILADQRRAFANWLEVAHDQAESDEQRNAIAAIAQQFDPLYEQFRRAAPTDESVDQRARDLHARINDLIGADDAALLALAAADRRESFQLIAVMLVFGIAVPWLAFVALSVSARRLGGVLAAIRRRVDDLAARGGAADGDLAAIESALEGLGYSKPDPRLAE
jgi:hypothetical protein